MSDNAVRWKTIEAEAENLDTGDVVNFIHCVPTFGNEHELTPSCWCNPKQDDECWNVIIHNHDFKLVD